MKATTNASGMPTIRATARRSPPVSRAAERRRRRRLDRTAAAIASADEDRLLLLLQALGEPVDVAGLADELLQRRDHHGRREVGPGVAVQELGDAPRVGDQLRCLLLH